MTTSRKIVVAISLLGVLTPPAFSREDRCGGEGPKPLTYVTAQFPAELIPTVNGVKEFVYVRDRDALIYRNEQDVLYKYEGGKTTPLPGGPPLSLSHVTDPTGEYVLAKELGHPRYWVLNHQAYWSSFFGPDKPLHPLYWRNGILYGFTEHNNEGRKIFQVYTYTPGDLTLRPTCRYMANTGEDVRAAKGHLFPHLFLYQVQKKDDGFRISQIRYNVSNCLSRDEGLFENHSIPAPIIDVYRFYPLKSVAIRVGHPENNLLWKNPKGCRYFNVAQLEPMVLHVDRPVIITCGKEQGISYIDLDGEVRTNLLYGFFPISALRSRDLWSSNNGAHLFLAPRFWGEKHHHLLRLKLATTRWD